jgi:hypothetical protein
LRRPDGDQPAPHPFAPAPEPALPTPETPALPSREQIASLKQRLEGLVRVASAKHPRPARGLGRSGPLEELVQGCLERNERGEFFLIEESLPLDAFHGDVPLSRLHAVSPETVRILEAAPDGDPFDLSGAVFLDTETTGLAGGTGTTAFLIGVGWVESGRFELRQFFMRDYHEEPAMLAGLTRLLERFERIVTFNGRMYDVPLLETRYRLNRQRWPLDGAPHLDLLHPARRLWRADRDSCRLQALEASLLGVRRRGDIPGEEIPHLYFDFVRRRDARELVRVFQHNRIDILSLAALSAVACQWVEDELAESPADTFSLGRLFERAGAFERGEAAYRRVLDSDDDAWRVPALLSLAARAKRSGDFDTARSLWGEAAARGEYPPIRELAMDLEHRQRELSAALALVEGALGRAAKEPGWCARGAREDLQRRRARLNRKLLRQPRA